MAVKGAIAIANPKRGRRSPSRERPLPVFSEPVRGAHADPRLRRLSGADQRRAFAAGRIPMPPTAYLTGMRYVGQDNDGVTWEQPLSPWFLTSQGVIPGGFLAAVTESALGSAIASKLAPGTTFSTSELSIDFLKAVSVASGTLIAHSHQVHADERLALSECTVWDAGGAPVIHATSRNVLEKADPEAAPGASEGSSAVDALIESMPRWVEPEYTTPHPYLRPPVGEVLSEDTWGRQTGKEILQLQLGGRLPMPPIHYLTGMRPTDVGDGQATFAMPATGWLTNGQGTVQAGFIAMLAYSALDSAIQTTVDLETGHVPIDLKVSFLRPVFAEADPSELVAHGVVAHRGRKLAVAEAEVLNADGKPVAVAMGSHMLLPGQPASSFI
jgi:uncharacterized protein (TIGR00369 family)